MKNKFERKASGCFRAGRLYLIPFLSFLMTLSLFLRAGTVLAQEADRIEIDASALAAGEAFTFTVTVNSDEMRSFADAQMELTAVLCPAGEDEASCQTLSRTTEGEDDTTMRVVFTAEALPGAGDYNLDVSFRDEAGSFASQSASYLLRGVRPSAGAEASATPTSEAQPTVSPTSPSATGTPEPEIDVPITVKPVKMVPAFLGENGEVLYANATIYVSDPYYLSLRSDSVLNDSVTVEAALPASLRSAPLDPESECLQYLNADGTALELPGSLWNEENGGTFRCELRYTDRVWLPAEPVSFSMIPGTGTFAETFEMLPLKWSAYPMNITKHPATHQAQIFDSRGNLLCSDTVACGMFYSDEVYRLTYRFPAEWGGALPSGRSFSAEVNWPAEWAASISRQANIDAAVAYGDACAVDEDGNTYFELTENPDGRYTASCTFSPGAVTDAVMPSIRIHLDDNAWAVNDLNIALSPVIIRESSLQTEEITPEGTETSLPTAEITPEGTETPLPTVTAEPGTGEPLPDIEIIMTVKPVTLTPSIADEEGNTLVYGSTLYVGEPYYLRISADSPMNDSVDVNVDLPASFLSAPLDPMSECLDYLNDEGTGFSIPGGSWNSENNNTFNCELRFTDSTWMAANPLNFSISPSGIPADETFEMSPLSWNYYPVNIAKYAATHQVQISDSRGNLICSDTVPCGVFNADDIYIVTYKFPADWGEALPSGRSFSADLQWPENWAMGLENMYDPETVQQFADVCAVGPDGVTRFVLQEVSAGRYAASCAFEPASIANPVQSAAVLHLDDASWQVSDLNVMMPGTIIKKQAVLSPSLVMQVEEGSAAAEQIRGGTITSLYKTTSDMPNAGGGFGMPALYTLKAQVEGISSARAPQWSDYVQVNWSVFDALAQTGDLPACLEPNGNGYKLGELVQTADGTWQSECSFRFPMSMPESTFGGVLQMELFSGMYNTTASTGVASQPFLRQILAVNLDIPDKMVPTQPMRMAVRLTDETGGLSDYARAVISRTGALVTSSWEHNAASTCQGIYDLSDEGESSCTVLFDAPVNTASVMHFDLETKELGNLFNIQFRPSADIYITEVARKDVTLTPSLALQMAPNGEPGEQISGGWITRLYRTSDEMPNLYMSSDSPARYTLSADISGIFSGSEPQPGDYVRVNWNMLDELAQSGELPSCILPADGGYMLGVLEPDGEDAWTTSCDFFFPQTMSEELTGGNLSMELVSAAYNGSAAARMNGKAFTRENLYVDLTIPEHMLVRQMTEFRVKVSDDSGSLSDYSLAILNAAGATLRSDWDYNYVTTCQGLYNIEMDGTSSCSALFEAPTAGDSIMHFEFISPALENLFSVTYRPSEDIHIAEISNPKAVLSVKLFHAGNEIPLPASDDDVFHVGEAYQLQFYLTPEAEYRDVLDAVSVDNEGLVMDWYRPLRIRWGMIPGGETSLNFYRDGDHFVARYDFSFEQGDLYLDGILGQLVAECWIENWEISGISNMEPVQLPSRIDKNPVSLELSGFTIDSALENQSDVYVNRNAEFSVKFNGSLDYFDPGRLIVGYEANGIKTPIDCFTDYESGIMSCSFVPVCTDYNYDTYPAVCGTGLSLYAEYTGDPYNEPAAVAPKTFNVKRADLRFYPEEDGSLSEYDLYTIQEALPDLSDFADAGLRVGTWTVESFLPREVRSDSGSEFKTYPVIFRYEKDGDDELDESLLRLDVHFQKGEYLTPTDEIISLKPTMVTDDTVVFDLDFGSMEMLDDGRLVQDALADAVTITSLEVRYPGSVFIAPSSARYEAENVTFALKVLTVLDMDLDISMPGVLRFGGAAADELMLNPFTVYCSQLYQEMKCSAELPLDILNENGEPLLSEIVEDGCWGKVRTKAGSPEIYVNNSVYPKCYLSAVDFNGALMIAGDY